MCLQPEDMAHAEPLAAQVHAKRACLGIAHGFWVRDRACTGERGAVEVDGGRALRLGASFYQH